MRSDGSESTASFFDLALTPQVVRSAIKVSLLVGTVLVLINHGPALVAMKISAGQIVQMVLTYLVPYCVSTYSAVRAIQNLKH